MKKIYLVLLLMLFVLTGCITHQQNRATMPETQNTVPSDQQNEAEESSVFLESWFRENNQLLRNESPDYSCYNQEGELILDFYLDQEEEKGTGIYYGESQTSKYITQFDTDKWQMGMWEDNKYSLKKAGESAKTDLEEYQNHLEYNDRGQIRSFYSEGIITDWGDPQKEKLVEIEFFYRNDGTLERKQCQYNPRLYGTTRQYETFYYNAEERLTYSTAYITHGMLSDYYFYDKGENEPTFRLTLDQMGSACIGELVKYDNSFTDQSSSVPNEMWQDAYAELLRTYLGNHFYLCDIDGNGIPQLLLGGPATDTGKMAEFDVYAFQGGRVEWLGTVTTLSWSGFWLDGNNGILGYLYGAGGGETYRYFIDYGMLFYDGQVLGYQDKMEGNYTHWFRGSDGNKITVTEENKNEYERIYNSMIGLEPYIATEDTISTVIYGGSY